MTASRDRLPHYWPNARQLLLLRASLDPGGAADLWPRIAPWLDLAALDSATARLLPQLGHALRQAGVDHDSRLTQIDAVTAQTEARNRHRFQHVGELIAVLEANGIKTMVLKGAALAVSTYEAIGLRPMGDLDLLVPTAAAEAAMTLANEGGWTARHPFTTALRRWSPEVHTAAADGCQLDVHWHVFHDFASDRDDDALWTAALPLDLAGTATRRLSPSDELLHVTVHGLRWARTPGIRWVADAALLIQRETIDWQRLLSQARERRFSMRARMALGYLRRHLDVPVPEGVLADLHATRVTPLERLEYVATSREHATLRRLPQAWCHFVRSAPAGDLATFATFPRYLADAWDVPSAADLPSAAIARIRTHWLKRDAAS